LKKAHDAAYKYGFENGIMMVGEFKDKHVKEAKPLVKKYLIENNQAYV